MAIWTCFIIASVILLNAQNTKGGVTDLWDLCGCRWDDWQAWGDCDSECNGSRVRKRAVWLYTNKDGCPFNFTTCATRDMGSEYSRCNAFCHNGGTSDSYNCTCMTGYYGDCCGFQIDCGEPGSVENGELHGGAYFYGATISYTCYNKYIMTNGSTERTCQLDHLWSGTKPYCAYYDSCSSVPCKNGGTCNNIPDDFVCVCSDGWSGKDCEMDIQPPVISNCSDDINVTTSETTVLVEWTLPTIVDPHNFPIEISYNYPTPSWTFPWGDFPVSYSALKPSNGFRNECSFRIRVRPNPCPSLTNSIPINGAVVCSNWKKDYGQFCKLICKAPYTVPRGVDPNVWYVCGASGSWIPSIMPNCSVNIDRLQLMDGYTKADTIDSCTGDNNEMKNIFIEQIKSSPFGYFCDHFSDECMAENVFLTC